jgi:cytochrome c peroxidase
MKPGQKYCLRACTALLALAVGSGKLHAQGDLIQTIRGGLLFTLDTFGGNGRTCVTCHSLEKGTVSPQDAQARLRRNPRDPLFVFDGSDDGQGHGTTRMTTNATILVEIQLPPNVSLGDDPAARSVILRRGIPTTRNTPALDPVLMLDGRDPDLQTQALHAIQRHAQPKMAPSPTNLSDIAAFEKTPIFFSSLAVLRYAQTGVAPKLPEGTTDSERRGRRFFVDADLTTGDLKNGACAACHSGPMLNQTNEFLAKVLPVGAGTRFQSVNVSEFNAALNPVRPFIFRNSDGSQATILSPDPGRALITGVIDGDPNADGAPFFTSLNAFKIPTLWGVKDTAPYFHDNSAKTLEDVAAHYARFFQGLPGPVVFTAQDQADMAAYMKLLN